LSAVQYKFNSRSIEAWQGNGEKNGEVRDLGYLEILTDRLNNRIYYLNSPTPWGIIQLSIFTDCSGGNSSPSHPADAGGCTFS
jgi:hypothetical protein